MSLCPNMVLTWMMSLVLWYSIVAFQCLRVWKWISLSRGLLILLAIRFFSAVKVFRCPFLLDWKTLSFVCGSAFSIVISCVLIGSILSLLPFSAVM